MKSKNSIHLLSDEKRQIGDIMPAYIDGVYHIFYLLNGSGNIDINHEHTVTRDFIHYKKLSPSIKHTNIENDYMHNGCMFTGCYLKIDETYHTFFTSYNLSNPIGREFILHRVNNKLDFLDSDNEEVIEPDGKLFSKEIERDFRDPAVYFNEKQERYEMFLLTNLVGSKEFVYALYTSKSPHNFQPKSIISEYGDECPSLYKGNKYYFIHGCHRYIYSKNRISGYKLGKYNVVDLPFCRAAKLVDDGKHTIWLGGWINGKMSIPRIVSAYKNVMTFKFYYPLEKKFDFYKQSYEKVDISNNVYLIDFQLKNKQKIELISRKDKVVISIVNKKILFSINEKKYTRKIPFLWKSMKVKLLLEDDILEAFFNKMVVLTIPLEKAMERKIIVNRQAIVVREWREES